MGKERYIGFQKPIGFIDFFYFKMFYHPEVGPIKDRPIRPILSNKTFSPKKQEKHYWFLKSNISFLTQNSINGNSLNWTPTGYATHLPSGSSANLTARRGVPSLMGYDGRMGWDGDQKGPLIFFILRYICREAKPLGCREACFRHLIYPFFCLLRVRRTEKALM